jgi:NTP pyrophosphatase (non-canonical NTP hydrolase)
MTDTTPTFQGDDAADWALPTLNETRKRVIKWADERQILTHATLLGQVDKLIEEAEETKEAILNADKTGIIDGIGDSLVVLTILADMADVTLEQCFDYAYNEIKDRRGVLRADGTFVKEADLSPEELVAAGLAG